MKRALYLSLVVLAIGCGAGTSTQVGPLDGAADVDAGRVRKMGKPDAGADSPGAMKPDAGHDATMRACVPGQQSSCACLGGRVGVQVCSATGSGYGACQCADSGSPGSGCSISGTSYASGAVNPQNPCQSCEPGASRSAWTTTDGVNASCPKGDVCSGTCQAGCWIDGAFYASGATANDGCELCTPSASTTEWQSVTGSAHCPSGGVCNGGSCESGCLIGGIFYMAGATMNDGCEVCTPTSNPTGWTDAASGTDCGNGQVCGSTGLCGTQCDIGGTVVVSAAVNPSDPCESCQPGTSTTAWTSVDGPNAGCSSGEVCSGEPATCTAGCFIDGGFFSATALNPDDPCETCQPGGTGGTTAWTDVDGVNGSCPVREVCNGQPASCVSGCFIGGSFYAANATANNGCEVCSPGASTGSWTDVSGAASCPSGEVCQAGGCVSSSSSSTSSTITSTSSSSSTISTSSFPTSSITPSTSSTTGSTSSSSTSSGSLSSATSPSASSSSPTSTTSSTTTGPSSSSSTTTSTVPSSARTSTTTTSPSTTASVSTSSTSTTTTASSAADAGIDAGPLLGSYDWGKQYGKGGEVSPNGVASDPSGNAFITGSFTSTINFGDGTLTSAGGLDIFVAKIDARGRVSWSKRFGDTAYQSATGVASDAAGDVAVTGSFSGSVDFGGGTITSAGGSDIFLAMFDPAGNYLWAQQFGDANPDQYGGAVAFDASGNIVIDGLFYGGTVNFGTGGLTGMSNGSIYLAKFDSSGNAAWSETFDDTGTSAGPNVNAVTTDTTGAILFTGMFNSSMNFGAGALTYTYPFYRLANRSGLDLWMWEGLYAAQFVSLEFFFRGFILQGLRRALGSNAVFVMIVPYCMIHYGKPLPETLGAIGAGLILGTLAMRTKSIWGGVLIHIGVAMTMDVLALRGCPPIGSGRFCGD